MMEHGGLSEERRNHKGNVTVKRALRYAGIALALSTAVVGASAVAAAPAFADGATATTLTVTGNKTTLTTGKSVSFTAVVAPSKIGSTKITGAVDWTVTGADGSSIPCTSVTALTGGGKSRCKVDKGALLAGSGPYTAVASYPGDANFGPSTGSTTLSVTTTSTRVKIALSAVPTSGAQIVVTATVVDGPATDLISGDVLFAPSSQYHSPGVGLYCVGTLTPIKNNNTVPVVNQVATCTLPAGWMTVPKATVFNPKPQDGWSVTATYIGNTSFMSSYATKKGTAKS